MAIAKLTTRERELIDGSNPGLNLAGFADRLDAIIAAVNAAATIEAAEIAAGAVTEAKIGTGAVTATKIGAGAVTAAKLAAGLNVKQVVVAGNNASILASPTDVASVVSILAFVTSGKAAAAKALLELTTDYTVAGGQITLVTNQSANTLVITYLAA